MLITLVQLWEAEDGGKIRVEGISGTQLAFASGILSSYKSKREDYSRGEKEEISVAAEQLENRLFMTTHGMTFEPEHSGIKPTSLVIDHAHWLMHPWYVKMWHFFKGDVRTALIAVITAVVITIVTTLVLRASGMATKTETRQPYHPHQAGLLG